MSDRLQPDPGLHLQLSLQRADFGLSVDLRLPGRGITVLFGPSGSGKTTLLRCVAGLEPGARGQVRVLGEAWQDDAARVCLPAWRRDLGYVFQEPSLFEHLDVRRNLDFGLRRAGKPGAAQALAEAVALLGIGHLMDRRIGQLSGGESQRVAIARALATRPRLLLLDEPLSAIDPARRGEVLPWLERLRDELHIPMLYVTHAVGELARLADHLVVLDAGQVRTEGPADALLVDQSLAVLAGIEAGTLVSAEVAERDADGQRLRVQFEGGSLWLPDEGQALGARIWLRVLPFGRAATDPAPRAGAASSPVQSPR